MNNPFKRPKWKPKDISISIKQGELEFSATICYSEMLDMEDNSSRVYSTKNLNIVDKISGLIHRHKMPCWEVIETFSDRKDEEKVSICFTLHYYPIREPLRDNYIDFMTKEEVVDDDNDVLFHSNFGYITERFNGMNR